MSNLLQARWDKELGDISKQSYTKILSAHAKGLCKDEKIYPREPKDIFKAFKLCNWDDLKMVIIAEPAHIGSAFSTLSIGGMGGRYMTHNSVVFEKALKHVYDSTVSIEDYSMEYHAKQGVLFLPMYGSYYRESYNNPKKAAALRNTWLMFNRKVVKEIIKNKEGIVFLIAGQTREIRDLRDMISQLNSLYVHKNSLFFHIANPNTVTCMGGSNMFTAFAEILGSAIRKCDASCDKLGKKRITWRHKLK